MKGKENIYENAHKKDNTYKKIRALYKRPLKSSAQAQLRGVGQGYDKYESGIMWQPPSQRQKKFFFVFANCHAKAVDCRVINLSILFLTYYCVLKTRLHKWNNMLHGAHWLHPTNWHGPPTCTPTKHGPKCLQRRKQDTKKCRPSGSFAESLFSPKRFIVRTV